MIETLQQIAIQAPAGLASAYLTNHSLAFGGACFAVSALTHQVAGKYFSEGPYELHLGLEAINIAAYHTVSSSIGEPVSLFDAFCFRSVVTDLRGVLVSTQMNPTISKVTELAFYRLATAGTVCAASYILGYPLSLRDSYVISNGVILTSLVTAKSVSLCCDIVNDIYISCFKPVEPCHIK